MTKKEAHARIRQLCTTIDYHRYLYHVLDRQEISDSALDSLKHELYALEEQHPEYRTKNSPTQRVGGRPLKKFEKVIHQFPMLSMEDVFSFDELNAWRQRLTRFSSHAALDFFCELKMDGVAVSLVYHNGSLATGATRGDGRVGENVTENLKTVDAIPLDLRIPPEQEVNSFLKKYPDINAALCRKRLKNFSARVEVRGEVFMAKAVLEGLNKEQKASGKPLFANPRNLTAGSIRQLDPRIAAARQLSFYGYTLMDEVSFGIKTHEQAHQLIRLMGIPINTRDAACASLAEVETYYSSIKRIRSRLPYWTDGVVIVVNDNALFSRFGSVGKTPRGMAAYKFAAEQVTTVLEDVMFQVGRTGALTPVAYLRPVAVAGTTVSHATLHNVDEIKRLDVMVGDTVIIEKAGDIIPKIISVVQSLRPKDARHISIPQQCPICDSPVERREGEVALYCSNTQCFAKEREAIIHFVSRRAFDIEGLGEKIIEQLINKGLLCTAADIFSLKQGDLLPLERIAEKTADNLMRAIEQKKSVDLSRLVYALGIRHVGEQTAADLSEHFGTLERIQKASLSDLASVENIGEVVASSVVEYFRDKKHQEFIVRLLANGVRIKPAVRRAALPLSGTTFVLTGVLSSMSRDEAKEKIRSLGGKVSLAVSKETDYVVVGEEPGSKAEKAKKLGVPMLDEKGFLRIMGRALHFIEK